MPQKKAQSQCLLYFLVLGAFLLSLNTFASRLIALTVLGSFLTQVVGERTCSWYFMVGFVDFFVSVLIDMACQSRLSYPPGFLVPFLLEALAAF